MFCGKCGKSNSEVHHFCVRCGAALQQPAASFKSNDGEADFAGSVTIETEPSETTTFEPGTSIEEDSRRELQAGRTYSADTPVGVGGWLGFYCFGLAMNFVAICAELWLELPIRGHSRDNVTFMGPLYLILAGLIMLTVIQLWTKRPEALKYVKWLLILQSVIGATGLVLAGASEEGIRLGRVPSFYGSILTIAVAGIWYVYFSTSKRVWATYGTNL